MQKGNFFYVFFFTNIQKDFLIFFLEYNVVSYFDFKNVRLIDKMS